MAGVNEELNFKFCFISVYLHLNNHMWLMSSVLESAILGRVNSRDRGI